MLISADQKLQLQHLHSLCDLRLELSINYGINYWHQEERRNHLNDAVIDAIATLPMCELNRVFLRFVGNLSENQRARLEAQLSARCSKVGRTEIIIAGVSERDFGSQFPGFAQLST